jgi:hypothetical protein
MVLSRILPVILLISLLFVSCQSGFIYHPDPALVTTPASINLEYEEVRFSAADGTKLHGWWVPSREERGTVIHCHGNAGNISHRLAILETFNRLKLSTFIFDYRGFGQSEGSPSEKGTYADALAAWTYLVRDRKISPERIAVHGQSLGGAVAAWLAVKERPALLVIESSFTSARDVARHHGICTPAVYIITYNYATAERIGKLRCPVLVIHSRDDEVIPYVQGEKLFAAALEPKEFLEIRGSHNYGFIASRDIYFNRLDSFIKKHLPAGGDK